MMVIKYSSASKKEYPIEWEKMREAASRIKRAGNLSYMDLALSSKAYYILTRKGGKASWETIRGIANNLGWSIKDADLDKAVDFLDKIHLAHWE